MTEIVEGKGIENFRIRLIAYRNITFGMEFFVNDNRRRHSIFNFNLLTFVCLFACPFSHCRFHGENFCNIRNHINDNEQFLFHSFGLILQQLKCDFSTHRHNRTISQERKKCEFIHF